MYDKVTLVGLTTRVVLPLCLLRITSDINSPDLPDYSLSVAFSYLCGISYHNSNRSTHKEPKNELFHKRLTNDTKK